MQPLFVYFFRILGSPLSRRLWPVQKSILTPVPPDVPSRASRRTGSDASATNFFSFHFLVYRFSLNWCRNSFSPCPYWVRFLSFRQRPCFPWTARHFLNFFKALKDRVSSFLPSSASHLGAARIYVSKTCVVALKHLPQQKTSFCLHDWARSPIYLSAREARTFFSEVCIRSKKAIIVKKISSFCEPLRGTTRRRIECSFLND